MSNLFDLLEQEYPEPKNKEANNELQVKASSTDQVGVGGVQGKEEGQAAVLPVPEGASCSEASRPDLTNLWKSVPKDARNWIRRSLDTFISDLEWSAKDIRRQVDAIPPIGPDVSEHSRKFFEDARQGPIGFAKENERRATAWRSVRSFVSEMDGSIGVILSDQVELGTTYKLEP